MAASAGTRKPRGATRRKAPAASKAKESVPSAPGVITVALSPEVAVLGGVPGARVLLRGYVISSAPAESLDILDPANHALAAIVFGRRDEREAHVTPDGQTLSRVGFAVYLPIEVVEDVRVFDLWVVAVAQDGARFRAAIRLGCMPGRAALLAGPLLTPPDQPAEARSGVVFVEDASIDTRGRLQIAGWAVSAARIVAVRALAGDQPIGPATHGLDRPDVADAFPAFPDAVRAGFTLDQPLAAPIPDGEAVTLSVLTLTGASHSVRVPVRRETVPEVSTPPATVLLTCDRTEVVENDRLLINGWAFSPSGLAQIRVEVDGEPVGAVQTSLPRPDVSAEHHDVPADTGFAFDHRIPRLAEGEHAIHVIAVNNLGAETLVTARIANPSRQSFRVEVDKPVIRDGLAVDPITGRLTIEGWALARGGLDHIEVSLDGTVLGRAHHGMARPDVGEAFPDWEDAARSGFTFHCPARALPDGDHEVTLTTRSQTGDTHEHRFRVAIRKPDDPEALVSIRRHIKRVEQTTMEGVLDQLDWHPAFELLVLDASPDDAAWSLTERSIREQTWPHWRVTILAASPERVAASRARIAGDDRFRVIAPGDPAWLEPMGQEADIGFAAILAAGDELGRDALAAFALASGLHREADCLYADEFRCAPGQTRPDAFFKPDFSPALALSMDYLGRPMVVRPPLLAGIGFSPERLAREGFHAFALQCTEAAARVHHVTDLLARTDTGLVAPPSDPAAPVIEALERRGQPGRVEAGAVPGTWRVRPTAPLKGKVSIIIPTCAAKGFIETCLNTLRSVTAHDDFEIIVIDNIPDQDETWKDFIRKKADKVVEMPPPFNWSRFNNAAAAAADGDYLLFLNDDIEIEQPDWLDAMLDELAWPGVGVVGARLLYPNRTIQHAGMFLGLGMGRHAFRHAEETEPGYFGLALTRREVIAVTGACLLVRRTVFEALGGFDEAHDVINNDMDFCLRVHRAGMRTIFTPFATLVHHELASRGGMKEDFDTVRFSADWRGLFAAGDPYFNPRLSRYSDDYLLDEESLRPMFAGHPLIERDRVRSILVVKLDHLGDFITALPAVRRLKALFPAARLTALVAPASAAAAVLEPAIDEAIPFEFFHARSELGEKDLTEADLAALTKQLAPYRFDIAVDLRKHLSTRHILRCSGARVLAGYDQLDRFPWLDIALEWDGDNALRRKRSHIVDDLVNLVSAIGVATEPERRLFDPRPAPMPVAEVPLEARGLFRRPVVAIHPGSGNTMRRLPERHIPALIELLVERDGVSVVLVGGPDDVALAEGIALKAGRPDQVVSLAGRLPLRDLPRFLAACHLFIGGNSGPKHFAAAAAAGVPTVGVHSGVVDAGEWGPLGERTVALYRDMSCAPCFLAKPEDCPRALACIELIEPVLIHRMAEAFLARPVRPLRDPSPARAQRRRAAPRNP
jgi:ADP-heptose:LPS heptosyltransferase/GT2 family glycosyltransferase